MEDLNVCTYRPTMKHNCILDQPDVGHSKIPLCGLSHFDFTYGRPSGESDGTVKEVLFNWYRENNRNKTREENGRAPVDNHKLRYERIKLNKVPDIIFGDSSGVSEDIKAILCYGYQHMMIENMKIKEANRREKVRQKEERIDSRRRVILRVNPSGKTEEKPTVLWKMKRFANVKAKVST